MAKKREREQLLMYWLEMQFDSTIVGIYRCERAKQTSTHPHNE